MSAWDEARLGGKAGQRFALGLWHPMYKLASLAWVPPASERAKLHGKQRYVYALTLTLGPSASDSVRFTTTQDFYLTDCAASGVPEGLTQPFSLQLFETRTETRYMDFPIYGPGFGGDVNTVDSEINGGSTFTMPFLFRRIARIPKGSVLQMTVQNLRADNDMTVQVALGGYLG